MTSTNSTTSPSAAPGLLRLADHQDGVLTRAGAAAAGMTPAAVRASVARGDWRPLLRGSYLVEPEREGRDLQRSWARSAVLTIPGAVVAGRTAAALHGLEGAPALGRVEVVTPASLPARDRPLRTRQLVLLPGDVVEVDGMPVTSPVRTVADVVLDVAPIDALAVLDSALHRGGLSRGDLAVAEALVDRRRGCVALREVWAWADGRAENPLESRVRYRCLRADLVPDDLQREVRSEYGHVIARLDILFLRRRNGTTRPLVLEADGQGPHDAPQALYRDRWRANTLLSLGHDILRATWLDTERAAAIPQMVRAVL